MDYFMELISPAQAALDLAAAQAARARLRTATAAHDQAVARAAEYRPGVHTGIVHSIADGGGGCHAY